MGRVTVSYQSQEEFETILNVMNKCNDIHIIKVTKESQGPRYSKKYIHYSIKANDSLENYV